MDFDCKHYIDWKENRTSSKIFRHINGKCLLCLEEKQLIPKISDKSSFLNKNMNKINFETCQFRSKDKIKDTVQKCCGQWKELEDYKCLELNIFPLNAGKCFNCKSYKKSELIP